MKIHLTIFFSIGLSCHLIAQVLYTQQNVQDFNSIIHEAQKADLSGLAVNKVVLFAGKQFVNTPYVGGTLDKQATENLVVDLSGLDCVTYLESVVAFSRTIKKGKTQFEDFCHELTYIRYRDGVMNGYESRLHYFSEWIHNNEQKGILENITANIGGKPFVKNIHMMTTNSINYPHLNNHISLNSIKQAEEALSSIQQWYLPKEDLLQAAHNINDGDLIAITTAIDGLDVAHVGIAVHVNEQLHLMHASTRNEKVEISEVSLFELLHNKPTYTGIMVARLRN